MCSNYSDKTKVIISNYNDKLRIKVNIVKEDLLDLK